MIPESKLKSDCTPEIIKRMVELAEGFEFISDGNNIHVIRLHLAKYEHEDWILRLPLFHRILFPLLIHRAVEGINKDRDKYDGIIIHKNSVEVLPDDDMEIPLYKFKNYQPESLTPCECACLHCLIEVLKDCE